LTLRRTPGTAPIVTSAEQVVTARELALPKNAQEALRKGRERLYEKRDPASSLGYFAKVLKLSPDFYEADYYTAWRISSRTNSPMRRDLFAPPLRRATINTERRSSDWRPCFLPRTSSPRRKPTRAWDCDCSLIPGRVTSSWRAQLE